MPEPSHYSAEVLVATTWDCNLNCSYCFVRDRGLLNGKKRMPPSLAIQVVDALDKGLTHVETICVHLYGGEPLTNLPAMKALITRAKEKARGRFRFAITTNGTIASPAAIELLAAGNFQVVLSIDGPAEIHDECRRDLAGQNTHRRVMHFLQQLKLHTGCWVRGSAVVRSGWSLMQANAYLRSLPVDVIKAQAVRLPARTRYSLSATEQRAYLDDLEKVGNQVISELEAGLMPRDDRFSSRVLQLLTGIERRTFCGAASTTFGVTPDGTVLPCVLIDPADASLGHIRDDPKTWIDAGQRWLASRGLRAQCQSCSALPLCGGGCPALIPVCGEDECDLIRKNCEVAKTIFDHFGSHPEALLALAGVP